MLIAELRQPDRAGRVVLLVQGRTLILPRGIAITDMNAVTETIVGNRTSAVTFCQCIRFNADVNALLSVECVIHECTHALQERRMGKASYRATYTWQMFVSLFRAGPTHIHDDHLMEREARFVGQSIARSRAGDVLDIDVASEIYTRMGWVS